MKHETCTEQQRDLRASSGRVDFPATRDQLLEQAQQNGADQHVLDVISHMPNDDTYNNMPDVFVNTPVGKKALEQDLRQQQQQQAQGQQQGQQGENQ